MKLVNGTPILETHPIIQSIGHRERSSEELRIWWNVPYIIESGSDSAAYVLNGGAWDRSTCILTRSKNPIEDIPGLMEDYPAYRTYGSKYVRESSYTMPVHMIGENGETVAATKEQALEIMFDFLPK